MTGYDPRAEERARHLMMAALDGELAPAEREAFERLLADDPVLAGEWRQLQRVKEVTSTMAFRNPPTEVWDTYWTGVYRRLERGVAWVLVSLGAIVVLSWGVWQAVRDILQDAALPLVVKGGLLALIVGGVALLVSVVREKVFLARKDPYKDVMR
jgi:anti-sigma factor RsiW